MNNDQSRPRRRGGVAGALAGMDLGRTQPAPAAPDDLDPTAHTGPTAHTATPQKEERPPSARATQQPPAPDAAPVEPVLYAPLARAKKKAKQAGKPRTVYLYASQVTIAKRFASRADESGRFEGIVQGHIGVSLAVNTALDLLDEAYRADPGAVLDRALRVVTRAGA